MSRKPLVVLRAAVREARRRSGLPQQDFAARIGVTRATIRTLEGAKHRGPFRLPDADTVQRLRAAGIDMTDILRREGFI